MAIHMLCGLRRLMEYALFLGAGHTLRRLHSLQYFSSSLIRICYVARDYILLILIYVPYYVPDYRSDFAIKPIDPLLARRVRRGTLH